MVASSALFIVCAAAYATLSCFVAIQARNAANAILAVCCLLTAAWAISAFVWPEAGLQGVPGALDLVRALGWYGFLLHLFRRSAEGERRDTWIFLAAGIGAIGLGVVSATLGRVDPDEPLSLLSPVIAVRLGLMVCELLLIENLYFNLPRHARWHVAIPCVLLGGLACFDIVVLGDLVLFRQPSYALDGARALAMIIIAPLLVIVATRGSRWDSEIKLSHTAVFHSATLILCGAVLISLALVGQAMRYLSSDWGWMAEASVLFVGIIALGLLLASGTGRSRFRRMVVEHFFAHRYDYRRQWLDCIATLSGTGDGGRSALHARAIRALADVVDSPNGALYLREAAVGPFAWSGSWNRPAGSALTEDHPVVGAMRGGDWIVELAEPLGADALDRHDGLWLAIPLRHRDIQIGLVLVGHPRAPMRLDQEVFDLLRIVGREVATFIAEQRATQVMAQTRNLHDYGKRFAFVAHDIKNVSSQLALLLRNAEHHISNPEFQKDMLETVHASVQKITGLLRRLETPEADRAPTALTPVPRLEALVSTYRRVRRARIELEHDGSTATVAMGADAFDTAITHLLNNAVEASQDEVVRIRVQHEASQVVVDIVDTGSGMTAEFVRDHLFRPFATVKQGGSGIGAFQARELLRESGGDVVAITRQGFGTTMRVLLPRADAPSGAAPQLAVAER